MKPFLLFLLLGMTIAGTSCKKQCIEGSDEVTGIVKDYTGKLDGCAMMIALSNGGLLEVRTVPSGITLLDGKKVAVKYKVNLQYVSACMAGTIADITSLRYL